MTRIMAVDYGQKRVGVAITDPLCTIPQPLVTIRPKSIADLIKRLKCIASENNVGLIIVGNPVSLRGEPTEFSRKIERFIERLKQQLDIEVQKWDERYLSKFAVNKFKEAGLSAKKEDIDRVAASLMLEEYLLKRQS
ncbi:MAG: Holliday junction resolvase RuvX [candidate division WOR-3 bacterium]|nr:MAG: Holliday junction resolvase RuvX [candidate division WOR-3 bacterium]